MATMTMTLNGALAAVVMGGLMLGVPDTGSAARSFDERGSDYRSDRYSDRYSSSQSDRKLKEDIRSELNWSPFVDEDDIQVSVRNGVATLSGTVEDRSEMNDAIENAYEAGAKRVINQLEAREDGERHADSRQMSDQQLKKKIERNVKRAPHLRSDRVHIRAHNGVVTLRGLVDTEEEMHDLINRSYDAGAKDVVSQLGVRSGYEPRLHTDRLERRDHPLGVTSDSGTFDYH